MFFQGWFIFFFVDMRFFFSVFLIISGIALGILGYRERDRFMTPPPDTVSLSSLIVQKMRDVQRLETVEMTVTSVIKSKKEFTDLIPRLTIDNGIIDGLFQDELIIEIEGKVTAGFDLSQIATWDIVTIDGTTYITLPEPEILHSYLTDKTQVFERKLGILTKWDTQLESDLRATANASITQAALEENILQRAYDNAEQALMPLLNVFETDIVIE